MELELKNIGIIEEATVRIDGLTVIAGENDTGKSTVGKALFLILSYFAKLCKFREIEKENTIKGLRFVEDLKRNNLLDTNKLNKLIFYNSIVNGKVRLKYDETILSFTINKQDIKANDDFVYNPTNILYNSIFIETPIVWNFIDFFKDIALVETQMSIKLDYPYLMKDLSFKMAIQSNKSKFLNIEEKLINLMAGEFKKDELGRFYFDKKDTGRVEIVNTATGIKSFGILQMLSQNGWLNENTVLILDEPEVHLHPKWQLEYAKIVVELVKNGVKVLVTSHSPYMIEALKRYSEVEKIEDKINFYLAENGYIKHQDSLEDIFEKLVLPIRELKKLKMDRYLND